MLSVILVEPEIVENLGFIARVMKNFDILDLIMINPVKISEKAYYTAVHAKDVLKNAKILHGDPAEILKKLRRNYDYLIGTTAKITTDFNLVRDVIEPRKFFKNLKSDVRKLKFGLVIGRESRGLSNEELLQCDVILTIPTSEKYPAMNISHALAVLLYEYYLSLHTQTRIQKRFRIIPKKEKQILFEKIKGVILQMPLENEGRKTTIERTWLRLIGRIELTKREGYALMGFFHKLNLYLQELRKIRSKK